MSNNQSDNEDNTDELIRIALTGKTDPTASVPDPVEYFIIDKGIKEHPTDRLPSFLVFFEYTYWCKEKGLKPIKRTVFWNKFGSKFKRIKGSHFGDGGVSYYKIDKAPFAWSIENKFLYYREQKDRLHAKLAQQRGRDKWQKD